MEKARIPLIGNITVRNILAGSSISSTRGQFLKNCDFYAFQNPFTGEKTLQVLKRQGIKAYATESSFSSLNNIWPWWSYSNATGMLVYTGTSTAGGAPDLFKVGGVYSYTFADQYGITAVTEAKNSSGTDSVLITRGFSHDYYIYPRGGAVTAITVPSGSLGEMVTLKGWTFLANQDGKIYNSNLNDPTAGYTDFISADMFPDGLTYLLGFKNFLYAFGPASMEVFEVVDNTTGSPLRYIPQMHRKIGIPLLGSRAHCYGKDSVYFVGNDPGLNIFEINSNYNVEPLLSPYMTDFNPGTPTFTMWGTRNKLLFTTTIDAVPGALVYDPELKFWHWWVTDGTVSANFNACSPSPFLSVKGSFIPYQSNKVGQIVSTPYTDVVYQDAAVDITRQIITAPMDFGSNNYKTINYIKLLGDQATSSSTVSISWSDDDGQTYSTAQTVDMSSINPTIWGCGATRKRNFKIEDTLNGEVRYHTLEIGYTVNDH
jgi:hypothetical protein